MKSYPSITGKIVDKPIFAFDKLDGSQIRAEWTKKTGFNKFGSRKVLIDETHEIFCKVPEMVKTKFEKDLTDRFNQKRYDKVTCFFEYYGTKTFAGYHYDNDTFNVTLFDINPYKKGFLVPNDFIKLVGDLDIAKLLYQGKPNQEFIKLVKSGELKGMTLEGVVCKYIISKTHIGRFKVKNLLWIKNLRTFCKGDEELFNKLL